METRPPAETAHSTVSRPAVRTGSRLRREDDRLAAGDDQGVLVMR